MGIIADRIEEPDCQSGFILDGFPRNVPQAEALDAMLKDEGLRLDGVIEIRVKDRILIDRIKQRISESEEVRADDTVETLEKRLEVYHAQTAPLLPYYEAQGKLRKIDGMQDIDNVATQIEGMLEELSGDGA